MKGINPLLSARSTNEQGIVYSFSFFPFSVTFCCSFFQVSYVSFLSFSFSLKIFFFLGTCIQI